MDSDDVISWIVAILFIVGVFVLFFMFVGWSKDRTTAQCRERYGSSWVGKYASHGPNFCVNTDGSVKYLQ